MLNNLRRFRCKNKGAVLPTTILLFALIVTVGISLMRLISRDMDFASTALFTERAYFAAESGVEVALLQLKDDPTANIQETAPLGENTEFQLRIQNNKTRFPDSGYYNLPPKQNLRMRLRRGNDTITNLQIEIQSGAPRSDLQWKVTCPESIALQDTAPGNTFLLSQQSGKFDHPSKKTTQDNTSFSTLRRILERGTSAPSPVLAHSIKECFLTLQNLSENTEIPLVISSNQEFAPPRTVVQATGKSSQNTEKTVQFEYSQFNLSPFFDFGLYYTESEF